LSTDNFAMVTDRKNVICQTFQNVTEK